MSRFTIEFSQMIAAYAAVIDPTVARDVLHFTGRGSVTVDPDTAVVTPTGDQSAPFDYQSDIYAFNDMTVPVTLAKKFAPAAIREHTGIDDPMITTDNALNKQIMDDFYTAFARHFWGNEIGQENPLHFWAIFAGFLQEQLPVWAAAYQELIINKHMFITGLSTGNGQTASATSMSANGSAMAVDAGTNNPQNELKFQLNSADPAQAYNFNYASNVNGSKNSSQNESSGNTSSTVQNNSTIRSQSIARLVMELDTFANGIYLNVFQKAVDEGMFMMLYA